MRQVGTRVGQQPINCCLFARFTYYFKTVCLILIVFSLLVCLYATVNYLCLHFAENHLGLQQMIGTVNDHHTDYFRRLLFKPVFDDTELQLQLKYWSKLEISEL